MKEPCWFLQRVKRCMVALGDKIGTYGTKAEMVSYGTKTGHAGKKEGHKKPKWK